VAFLNRKCCEIITVGVQNITNLAFGKPFFEEGEKAEMLSDDDLSHKTGISNG
jgi:hypothetical protein